MTPLAASRPKALPPVSRMAFTRSTRCRGRSRSVSRVAGAPPRTSTPPVAGRSQRMTVQPVPASRLVSCPTRMPGMSVMSSCIAMMFLPLSFSCLFLCRLNHFFVERSEQVGKMPVIVSRQHPGILFEFWKHAVDLFRAVDHRLHRYADVWNGRLEFLPDAFARRQIGDDEAGDAGQDADGGAEVAAERLFKVEEDRPVVLAAQRLFDGFQRGLAFSRQASQHEDNAGSDAGDDLLKLALIEQQGEKLRQFQRIGADSRFVGERDNQIVLYGLVQPHVPGADAVNGAAGEISLFEVRFDQQRVIQTGAVEGSRAKVGFAQRGGREVRVYQIGLDEAGGCEVGLPEPRAGQVSTAEVGIGEVSETEIGLRELRVGQRRAPQGRAREISGAQVGSANIGLGQVRRTQVGLAQCHACQRRLAQVGFEIGILPAPRIPRVAALFEHTHMLSICHTLYYPAISVEIMRRVLASLYTILSEGAKFSVFLHLFTGISIINKV